MCKRKIVLPVAFTAVLVTVGGSAVAHMMFETDWYAQPAAYPDNDARHSAKFYWTHIGGNTSEITRVDWAGRTKANDFDYWKATEIQVEYAGCNASTLAFHGTGAQQSNAWDWKFNAVPISEQYEHPRVDHEFFFHHDGTTSGASFYMHESRAAAQHGTVNCPS